MNVSISTSRNKSVVAITRALLVMGSHTGERMQRLKRNRPRKMLALFLQEKKRRLL